MGSERWIRDRPCDHVLRAGQAGRGRGAGGRGAGGEAAVARRGAPEHARGHHQSCGDVHQGKHAEAAALTEEALATSRRVLGAGHPDTLIAATNLAKVYTKLGKVAEAAAVRALYNCE